MTPEPPKDPPAGAGAPVPDAANGDPRDATAEVAASVAVDAADPDVPVSRPNPALDALVARDTAAAAAAQEEDDARPKAEPPPKTTPAQEWGAAVVLMIVFLFICAAALSFFRG